MKQFQLYAPDPKDRVISPPLGQIAIYVENLQAGLLFSILDFVRNIFDYYKIYPTEFILNFIRLIINFALLCHMIPTSPSVSLFRAFFVLHPCPKAEDWWFFASRSDL